MWNDLWRREDVEYVLQQLNQRELPFKKYEFAEEEGKFQLLGTGAEAYVYAAKLRDKPKEDYAIKVMGFRGRCIAPQEFRNIVEQQKMYGSSMNHIMEILATKELYVCLDEKNNVKSTEEVGVDDKITYTDGNRFYLQFLVMKKYKKVTSKKKKNASRININDPDLYSEIELLRLAHDIGVAIMTAHEHNILHRDIKPENIFYSPKDKQYYLGDFGSAKIAKDGIAETKAGTEGYSAPEVWFSFGEKYDNTADIYSFGITLYRMMNEGRFPATLRDGATLKNQYDKDYELPKPINGSEKLFCIIKKMCEYNPDDRYQSMEEVLDAFNALVWGEQAIKRKKHRKSYKMLAILFAIAGIVIWKWGTAIDAAILLGEFAVIFYIQYGVLGELSRWDSEKKGENFVLQCIAKNAYVFILAINCLMMSRGDIIIQKCVEQQELKAWLNSDPRIIKSFFVTYDFLDVIYETCQKWGIWDELLLCDFKSTGLIGFAFCVFWIIREWYLFGRTKKKE